MPVADSAELVAVQGPLAQQHFSILPEGLAIGRQTDNDIVLAGELTVSRHHAAIALEHGQYVVYDRDSANGTWVNGQRIFRHVLVPGDRVQIWQSEFVFGYPGTPLPGPVSPTLVSPVLHVEGDHFAGYTLEDLVGRGGMSEVFKARDQHGRTVAIKILQQSDPYLVSKFMQEGNKIGPLLRDHPNIVYVYEFGQGPDGRLYIVMEYVDAPSLRRVMQRPLGEEEVVGIMGQVCSALAFAHQNNVVHRDIKPENILVTAEGEVKVLDFGIAKLTSASTVTRDKIVGTPEYISPEQARGEPVYPASDVYSLGIVLYELLSGSVPFRRPRDDDALRAAMEVIRQHLKERPEPLRKRNPAVRVSSRLERVTMRALKKEIRERYATAKEMGQALGYKEPVEPRASPEAIVRANLLVVQGPRRGQRIQLPDGVLVLGRLELGSANTAISRHHANILFRGGTYWLEDLSKNGTWLDQQRVYGEAPLKVGSVITIGDNVLKLEQG
jgi:serine/threonine protein kinase